MSDLIFRNANDNAIAQRSSDGYIDATAMCKAAGKLFADYARLKSTNDYLEALSLNMGIPISALVESFKGGVNNGNSWVHPEIAVDLAKWLSPEFRILVNRWVVEWMAKNNAPGDRTKELEAEIAKSNAIAETAKLEQLRLTQSNGVARPAPKPQPAPTSYLTPEERRAFEQEECDRYITEMGGRSQTEQERKRQEMVSMLFRMAGGK